MNEAGYTLEEEGAGAVKTWGGPLCMIRTGLDGKKSGKCHNQNLERVVLP